MKKISGYSLLLVLVIFNAIIGYYYINNVNLTDGRYIYPLDDTYIHLSIAKNLALNNNWGVESEKFCSSSSSPFYTFLLSVLIRIFGLSESYPLVLNIIFGNLIFILIFNFFCKFMKNDWLFLLMSFFLISPALLHIQVLSGMEHTLHVLLVLFTVILFYELYNFDSKKGLYLFYLSVSLLCLTRYESMFLILPMDLLLMLNKKYKIAITSLFSGFFLMFLFGIYSISQGGFFFPNSLLIKGNINYNLPIFGLIIQYLSNIINKLMSTISILIPLILLLTLVFIDFLKINNKRNFNNIKNYLKANSLSYLVISTVLLHSAFASFGWLYRYESYLIAILYFSLIIKMSNFLYELKIQNNIKYSVFIFLSLLSLLLIPVSIIRFLKSEHLIAMAGKNIYDQQIQMSRFLNNYYNSSNVIANDIGAITYFTNIKLLDLVGLGSNSILKQKINDKNFEKNLSKFLFSPPQDNYKIMIIYDSWFNKINSKELIWEKVGELKLYNNVICGSSVVSFYTSDRNEVMNFKKNIVDFKKSLPKDVEFNIKSNHH